MNTKALILSATLAFSAAASAEGPWTGTWRASPQPLWSGDFVLPTLAPFQFAQQTLRQPMRVSLGGERWRVVVSNTYGTQPLRIGAAAFARSAGGGAIDPDASRRLTFGGQPGVEIPAGGEAVSDPVALVVPALGRVAVSLHLPGSVAPSTFHWDARETGYAAEGDQVAAPVFAATTPVPVRAFVSRLLVEGGAGSVVVLGDSLTDGNGSTPGTDRRWPDALAERLAPRGLAVQNAGISGARLLRDGMGDSASARLDREVFASPGVRAVIVALGTNDIGWPGGPFAPGEAAMTVERLAAGYRQLAERARVHGVRVIGTTVPPFEGALQGTPLEGHHSVAKDRVRQAVNEWIRTSGTFDAVVDFDAVLRDPAHPTRLRPAFDSGDHLHPGDTGYRAMAGAIDLDALGK